MTITTNVSKWELIGVAIPNQYNKDFAKGKVYDVYEMSLGKDKVFNVVARRCPPPVYPFGYADLNALMRMKNLVFRGNDNE